MAVEKGSNFFDLFFIATPPVDRKRASIHVGEGDQTPVTTCTGVCFRDGYLGVFGTGTCPEETKLGGMERRART